MTQPASKPRTQKPWLLAAIRDLRAAIDRLIEPTDSYVNNTYIQIPGLYDQLVCSLAGQQGSRNGSHARSLPPVWVDAIEQCQNIDLMIDIWTRTGNTWSGLRSLARQAWTPSQIREIRRKTGIINAWADDIDKLLNQDHVKHLTAACPACGAETVQKRDSAGELVRTPALQISEHTGCTCQNEDCGHYWAPSKFIDLCQELGMDLPAGVLE